MSVRYRLAAFHFPSNTRRAPAARRGLQNHACPGRHRDVVPFIFQKPRSSQAVRQRSHTPRIAGSNPASATIFWIGDGGSEIVDLQECDSFASTIHYLQSTIHDPTSIAREGVSKPASLGTRKAEREAQAFPPRSASRLAAKAANTRGSTGARDQFPTILRSSIAEHPPDKRKTAARNRAEGPSPVMSKQHVRLLTGSSWCESTLGSHGCVAETDQRPVEAGKSQARYLTQPPFSDRG
jgi:hypothetical protein